MEPSDPKLDHYRRLERLYHTAPCNEYFDPRMEISDGSARLRIDIQPQFLNGNGTLHGSVYFKALDDVAAFAVYSTEEMVVPTSAFTIYFIAPASSGTLEAIGKVVDRAGRIYFVEAEARCGERTVARGSGTYVRTSMPLSSLDAYAGD